MPGGSDMPVPVKQSNTIQKVQVESQIFIRFVYSGPESSTQIQKHTANTQKENKSTSRGHCAGHSLDTSLVPTVYDSWSYQSLCLCISCLCTWLSEVRQRFAKQWNLAVQSQATNEFSCLITTALQSNTQHNLFHCKLIRWVGHHADENATSTSRAVWDSVSCPRTLRHEDQGNQSSDLPITIRWLYPWVPAAHNSTRVPSSVLFLWWSVFLLLLSGVPQESIPAVLQGKHWLLVPHWRHLHWITCVLHPHFVLNTHYVIVSLSYTTYWTTDILFPEYLHGRFLFLPASSDTVSFSFSWPCHGIITSMDGQDQMRCSIQ